ncbi:hypothetical protein STEG23_028776, partial [Scotinomys teguina]
DFTSDHKKRDRTPRASKVATGSDKATAPSREKRHDLESPCMLGSLTGMSSKLSNRCNNLITLTIFNLSYLPVGLTELDPFRESVLCFLYHNN